MPINLKGGVSPINHRNYRDGDWARTCVEQYVPPKVPAWVLVFAVTMVAASFTFVYWPN